MTLTVFSAMKPTLLHECELTIALRFCSLPRTYNPCHTVVLRAYV
jgi:hypothetical protein